MLIQMCIPSVDALHLCSRGTCGQFMHDATRVNEVHNDFDGPCSESTILNYDCLQTNSLHYNSEFFRVASDFIGATQRFGEARHPGPLSIRTFNPTQLLGREDDIAGWPSGISTGCETSHTQAAMMVSKKRFAKHKINSIFSHPAEKHTANGGAYRGKPVGTVILSDFGMHPYPMDPPEHVKTGSRFVDAIVNIGHGTQWYICTIYGPPLTQQIYADGERVFLDAAMPGIQRAKAFKGPAVITGDFNRDLNDVAFWSFLQQCGWHDCAQLAFERFNFEPQHTCRDSTRRSFILVNDVLASLLMHCAVRDEFMFDTHPVLEATFNIDW